MVRNYQLRLERPPDGKEGAREGVWPITVEIETS